MNTGIAASKLQSKGARKGYALALQLLREAERPLMADRAAIKADVRVGPQLNFVLSYLERLREEDSAVVAGFAAVLSDVLASCWEGVPDPECYARDLGFRPLRRQRESIPVGQAAR